MLERIDQQGGLENTQAWNLSGRLHPVQEHINLLWQLCGDIEFHSEVNQWEVLAKHQGTSVGATEPCQVFVTTD